MITITEAIKEYVFDDDRDFQSAHASTLLALDNGEVLAAWFGGSWEGNPDAAIWMARRGPAGWEKPYVAAAAWGVPLWNPVLFRPPGGPVLLFYKEGPSVPAWRGMVKRSLDGGRTFSAPRPLAETPGDRGPAKNKPITLADGRIAAPGSRERGDVELWDSFVDYSPDGGETWEMGPFIPVRRVDSHTPHPAPDRRLCFGKGLIQPTLWESAPGHLHALLRSSSAAIFRSDSDDGGRTWSCAYNTGLPNNNSGIDLIKLPGGDLVLAANTAARDWGPRTPLVLSGSSDNGHTWREILTLEDGPGEYSYPALISAGNEILLSYTWRRERIAFWRLR